MENTKLLAILRAFKALFDNLPSELPDDEYAAAVDQIKQGYSEVLYPFLKTQHFAICVDSDGEYVSIFATEAERDAYIREMRKIEEERKERGDKTEITCETITFDDFLCFAEGMETDLNNYSLDVDGSIEFTPTLQL